MLIQNPRSAICFWHWLNMLSQSCLGITGQSDQDSRSGQFMRTLLLLDFWSHASRLHWCMLRGRTAVTSNWAEISPRCPSRQVVHVGSSPSPALVYTYSDGRRYRTLTCHSAFGSRGGGWNCTTCRKARVSGGQHRLLHSRSPNVREQG